eukprot:11201760-Lingulodinium_polyedra.AAC.1
MFRKGERGFLTDREAFCGSAYVAWCVQRLHPPSPDALQAWVERDHSFASAARSAPIPVRLIPIFPVAR